MAFWLNTYNELVRETFARFPVEGRLWRHRGLFDRVSREIDGLSYTPNVIEHGVLRRNRRPPFSLRRVLSDGDPRLASMVGRVDPRIHFALNCGAVSCPAVRVYETDRLDEQLEAATTEYFAQESSVGDEYVELPYLLRLYRADFDDPLEFAARYLQRDLRGMRVGYRSYDWRVSSSSR